MLTQSSSGQNANERMRNGTIKLRENGRKEVEKGAQ